MSRKPHRDTLTALCTCLNHTNPTAPKAQHNISVTFSIPEIFRSSSPFLKFGRARARMQNASRKNNRRETRTEGGLLRGELHTNNQNVNCYVHKRNAAVVDLRMFRDYFHSFLMDMFFSLSFCITCQHIHTCHVSYTVKPL